MAAESKYDAAIVATVQVQAGRPDLHVPALVTRDRSQRRGLVEILDVRNHMGRSILRRLFFSV